MTGIDWTTALADQIDWHWQHQLRPRLCGLTDEEYFFEPVPGCWSIRRRGTSPATKVVGSGAFTMDGWWPPPSPPPVTTIAWRLGHLIVGVLAARVAGHFGGPPATAESWDYAGTAAAALGQLDASYAAWIGGVRALSAADLLAPCGPAEGPYAAEPMATLVLHINRELIHHGAEVSLLRDLWAHGAR